jgi:hypothetical protein
MTIYDFLKKVLKLTLCYTLKYNNNFDNYVFGVYDMMRCYIYLDYFPLKNVEEDEPLKDFLKRNMGKILTVGNFFNYRLPKNYPVSKFQIPKDELELEILMAGL